MLEAVGLTKRYGARVALAPVSLRLEPGTCLGLAGANGSGKSTLLALLAQTLRPDGGDIRFQGRSVRGDRAFLRAHVGYVPQRTALLGELTVREQLDLWGRSCGLRRRALPKELQELLGLEELLGQRAGRLSGGMQKRVSIAMALMTGPEYLLMDEAFAALDARYRSRLAVWLRGHLARGGAVLWCSHEPSELTDLCDQAMVLDRGEVVCRAPAAEALAWLETEGRMPAGAR